MFKGLEIGNNVKKVTVYFPEDCGSYHLFHPCFANSVNGEEPNTSENPQSISLPVFVKHMSLS
jgi:hypothetical protein